MPCIELDLLIDWLVLWVFVLEIQGCERVAEQKVDVDFDEVGGEMELEAFGEDMENGEQEHWEYVHW